MSKHQYNYT